MDLSRAGAAFVRHHEGFVGRYYLDPAGVGTIGIGFTWRSGAFRKWWERNRPGQAFGTGARMSRAEAEDALIYLMREEYGSAVNRFLGKTVSQHVFDGMASVTFNAGPGTLGDRWAQAAKRGDLAAAADLLKTTRVTAGGRRLSGLVSRRRNEAELIELGDYTIGRPAAEPMEDGMLVRGESGEAVRRLQKDLQARGFYADGVVDGIFGPGTEAAVMAFQRTAGLADDGYAGPLTLEALAAPIPVPSKRNGPMASDDVRRLEDIPPVETKPKKQLSPVEQMNKPVKGAQGGLLSLGLGGAVVILFGSAGWLPEAWMEGIPAIALGTVVGGISNALGNFVGGYLAPDKRFMAE